MDLMFFLILDSVALMVATAVLTYYFIKDFLKGKNKSR